MPFETARDLKRDMLFRSGESTDGASGYDTKAIDYLNRVYKALASGGSEFLPEAVDDWWWLRLRDVLTLEPTYKTGSLTLVNNSASATLSSPPATSLIGYRIRVVSQPDLYFVLAHAGGDGAVTLDSPFTGPSGVYEFRAMKVLYTLNASVVSILGPMTSFRSREVIGMTPERMDELYPLARLDAGMPSAFALEDEQTVRFNAGGFDDGNYMRLEYLYRPKVEDLEDSDTSIPLVPIEYRHLLSDMALAHMATTANDDRATAYAATAKSGLVAMVRENRRRLKKMDNSLGTIRPRALHRLPGRTLRRDADTGVIIT